MDVSSTIILSVSALLIAITTLFLVKWFINVLLTQQKQMMWHEEKKQGLMLRFQAYERLVLFVERISPESLIIREQHAGLNCQQFHTILIKSIRQEFEHNLAVQVYVAGDTWETIKQTREEVVKLINSCAGQINPKSPSIELGQMILEQAGGSIAVQLKKALKELRTDVSKMY